MELLISMLNNITLMISLSIIYSLILHRWVQSNTRSKILSGILFGMVAISSMLNPVNLLPGVFFDSRFLILSIAGLFGGPITAFVAILIAIVFRIWLGGAGVFLGICSMAMSICMGMAYYYLSQKQLRYMQPIFLWIFGLLVHLFVLTIPYLVPGGMGDVILAQIAVPTIIIYPIISMILCLILLDQQKHVKTEQIAQTNHEKLEAILNTTPLPIFYKNTQGIYENCNLAYAAFLGIPQEKIVGASVYDIAPQELASVYQKADQELFQSGGTQIYETRMLHADKTFHDVIIHKSTRAHEGKLIGLVGVIQDITERKRDEETLQYERDILSQVMDTSPVGIIMMEPDGKISLANRRAEEILGLGRDEIHQRAYNAPEWHISALDGGPFPEEQLAFKRVITDRKTVYDVQHTAVWPNGKRVLLSVNAAPLLDKNNQVERVVTTIEDITERKKNGTGLVGKRKNGRYWHFIGRHSP